MDWNVKKIINFDSESIYKDGYAHFGFHDSKGNLYSMNYFGQWVGYCDENGRLKWSAGNKPLVNSDCHITIDLQNPHYITDTPDAMLLIASAENKKIYKVNPAEMTAFVLIDGDSIGLTDLGNCVFDYEGNIWVNEIQGCRIWKFTQEGVPIQTLGNGTPGFQTEDCSFSDVRFNWIYDIRTGPDGNIYVLDSKNFALRMIDLKSNVVKTIAGTGLGGYSGDGENAINATFGSNPDDYFNGPWSLSLDEEGNIYVGDTQNHVVRMIERSTNIITTIAGNPDIKQGVRNCPSEKEPLKLNLPKICSLDYFNGCLFIPEWDGDMIVLSKG